MRKQPLISIVVPTRNRPEYVCYALESLLRQTNSEFEVIVSDNHTGRPCKAVFDRLADRRFRYVVPPAPMAMHDHWEFAVNQAAGDFVTVLIDKTVLRPTAIAHLLGGIAAQPADAYSWWNEGYDLLEEEAGNIGPGRYVSVYSLSRTREINTRKEIERRFTFDVKRGREGKNYYYGKICFGAYSRQLLQRIRETFGRVFTAISPDYTSMIAALAVADRVIDLGRPLLISMNTRVSNGMLCATQSEKAIGFLREIDPTLRIVDRLPISGLYMSVHNLVAYDYLRLATTRLRAGPVATINLGNLAQRAHEDLAAVQVWRSEGERTEQTACLEHFVRANGITLRPPMRPLLRAFGRVQNAYASGISPSGIVNLVAREVSGRVPFPQRVIGRRNCFGSVVEAAAAADRR